MKKIPALLGLAGLVCSVLLACCFTGCERTETQWSKELTEPAVVVDAVYTPSRHGNGSGLSPGITGNGGISIQMTNIDIKVPEKYAVVFKCQHGKFIVQGKELWNGLTEGDSVTVLYREEYRVAYADETPRKIKSRSLIGYDFLNVIKKDGKPVLAQNAYGHSEKP